MQRNVQPKNKKEDALRQYNTARGNLLLMIVLTAVNIVLFAAGADTMLLFSATVPYFIAIVGILTEVSTYAVVGVGIAAIILGVYLVCWIFSKKYYGWMIAALVLFVLDSLAMVYMYVLTGDVSGILDALIHIWVLYYLIVGVIYGHKLKHLTPEDEMEYELSQDTAYDTQTPEINSVPIRVADSDVKFRVLAQCNFGAYDICYRRVKRINELVVNGNVYDDVEMLLESPHELVARVDGHSIVAGYNGTISYICVDGQRVAKKLRLF